MTGYPHLSEVLPQLATPDEVGPMIGMSALGVVRQCRSGKLPGVKVGNRWFVHVRKLAELLESEASSERAERWPDSSTGAKG